MSYKFGNLYEPETEYIYIIRLSDGASIPCDPDNVDYQEYLEWAKTNTTEEPTYKWQ